MTDQEIFDTVATHLAQQGHRATKPDAHGGGCFYRAPNGDKCAVGCLITDDEYDPEMDKAGDLELVQEQGLLPDRLQPHYSLLRALQAAHDQKQMKVPDSAGMPMLQRLRDIAGDYGVSPAILDALSFPDVWA